MSNASSIFNENSAFARRHSAHGRAVQIAGAIGCDPRSVKRFLKGEHISRGVSERIAAYLEAAAAAETDSR